MTTKFYLDGRGLTPDVPWQIKISLCHKGRALYIGTGVEVTPAQWDSVHCRIIGHPQKSALNVLISQKKCDIDTALYELTRSGKLHGLDIGAIKQAVLRRLNPEGDPHNRFMFRFDSYASSRRSESTRVIYDNTASKIRSFDRNADKLDFDDINKDWLRRFDSFMASSGLSVNYRNIHLRNIRAVFNDAIDDEVTSCYPFRRFTIKAETSRNRALTAAQLHELFTFPCADWQREYVDMAKLMFMFCGINIGDMALLRKSKNIVEYRRLKTGQPCSFSIIPEAQEIIDRYPGKTYMLNILDRYKSYSDYLHHMNHALKTVGLSYCNGQRPTGEPICPAVSTYWMRYSFASIAAELDVPKETIAAALAHATGSVTDIYIRTDYRKKVDEAIRKVVDYVLYGI